MKNSDLIHSLNEKMLKASTKKGQELFYSMVNAIQEATNCRMCTLWSINTNNTNSHEFQSTSLIVKKLENDIEYPSDNREDFVHDLEGCFIKHVLEETKKTEKPYYSCDITGCKNHRSIDLLNKLNLKYFINIPIPNQDNKIIAFLQLAFTENPKISQAELLLAETIRDVISTCFYRYMLSEKRKVMQELVENYESKANKKLIGHIFNPIITKILPKHFSYEGASFFMWDSYMNCYKLMATTGIKHTKKSGYYGMSYKKGEGLTGQVAHKKASIIYDDLDKEKAQNPHYLGKFREKGNPGKTMMIVPIFNPSNKGEVIGILRFTNKRNQANKKILDYFNDIDRELIEYVANYLALVIDYFLGDEERSIYVAKLSHEFSSPAMAIRTYSDRILENIDNESFVENRLKAYLESIKSFSDKQIQQTTAISYIFKTLRNIPKEDKYKVDWVLLKDIVIQSKEGVGPIIEIENSNISLDSVTIDDCFPLWKIKVDKSAFEIVFDSLFTNAVKYRGNNHEFQINVKAYEREEYLIVEVSDNGLGIEKKDKDNIFYLGFRGENTARFNSNGTGVGLHVVKQIISDFNGEISVSNFNSPTTFEIKLPKSLLR